MDRSKLKRGTFVLTAGTLAAIPGCYPGPYGVVSVPCCDDGGFFVSDAGDGGTPDGGKNGN